MKRACKCTVIGLALFGIAAYTVSVVSGSDYTEAKQKNDTAAQSIIETETDKFFKNAEYTDIDTCEAETCDTVIKEIQNLAMCYPQLIKEKTVGVSQTGRNIPAFTLGSGQRNVLIIGGIHAREHITAKFIMCCVQDYCRAYYSDGGMFNDYNVRTLLDTFTVTVIPCLNIDGADIILADLSPAEFVYVQDITEYKANYNGVDLNRNFPFLWDELDTGVYEASEYLYKGNSPASESETQTVMDLCESVDFEFAISFHIRGNVIYWDDCATEHDNSMYSYFAERLSAVSGLEMLSPETDISMYAGAFEDWFRNTYGKPGFCVELMSTDICVTPEDNTNYIDFSDVTEYENTVNIILEGLCASVEYENN